MFFPWQERKADSDISAALYIQSLNYPLKANFRLSTRCPAEGELLWLSITAKSALPLKPLKLALHPASFNMDNSSVAFPGPLLLLPALTKPTTELVPCPTLAACSLLLSSQAQTLLVQGDVQRVQPDGLAECTARKLRSTLTACKKLAKDMEALARPSQGQSVKFPSQCAETCCAICSNAYDCIQSVPLCLACGHTMCSACVLTISRRGLVCPFDRIRVNTDFLPVNLAIAEAALSELEAVQCPDHNCQLIAFCVTEGRGLCGLCAHEEGHSHCLLDSQEAERLMGQKLAELVMALTAAGALAKQLVELTMAVEALLLKLTVKFNGFSLIHKASKPQRRQARRFSDQLLRIRSSLAVCENAVERYVKTHRSLCWNASRVPRWALLSLRVPTLPNKPKVDKALEAVQRWLAHNG